MKLALTLFIGLLGGLVATGPMTLAMILGHRRLGKDDRYSLPPREITNKLIAAATAEPLGNETT